MKSSPRRGNQPTIMVRRLSLGLFLAIFGLAALVDVVIASRSGLWPDEVFSLAIATGHSLEHPAAVASPTLGDFVEPDHPVPAEEFRRYLRHDDPPASPARVIRAVLLSDTNPPLYYLLLYAWTLIFGTSDIVLRLFSIVCSLACVPLLASIARRIGGEGAVLASCVLFAFSPLAICYSTEGRMYSLLWLCVLATVWASLFLQERGRGVAIYALWIVASTAGFLTHYFFVFPWLAIVAYLLIRPGKLARPRLAACLSLTALMILPWYIRLPESLGNWRVTKDWLKWQPIEFDRLAASQDLVVPLFSGRSQFPLWDYPTSNIAVVAAILFGIVAVAMVWRLRAHVFSQSRLLLWLLFAATCTGPLAFDFVQHTYTTGFPRYASAALPGAYLLAAVGLACMNLRIRIVMLILIVLAWAPNVLSLYNSQSRYRRPIREISRAASANSSHSDLILVHSIPSGLLGIAHYVKGPTPLASWVGQLGTRRVPESLQTLAAGRTRIILVKVHWVREPAPEADWLRANAVVAKETRFTTGTVVDFRPINSKTF
jgi:hypothetical protein